MKTVCGWCTKLIKDDGLDGDEISHGLCLSCKDWMLANTPDRTLNDLLDDIGAPVMAVDSDGRIQGINGSAESALGKKYDAIRGKPGGDVMECEYARHPSGCGHTEHCVACTIRSTVMQTHETGEPCNDVRAYQMLHTERGAEKKMVLISTYKKGDLVLLRIDDIVDAV